jgi:hypothetical protein
VIPEIKAVFIVWDIVLNLIERKVRYFHPIGKHSCHLISARTPIRRELLRFTHEIGSCCAECEEKESLLSHSAQHEPSATVSGNPSGGNEPISRMK